MGRSRTIWIVASFVLAAISLNGQVAPKPPAQVFPSSRLWTIEVGERPLAPPVAASERLFLALQSGVSARRLTDGTEIWQAPIVVDGPMAAADSWLLVSADEELILLDGATGSVLWRVRAGVLTAPPLLSGEWLIVAYGDGVSCYRVASGESIWRQDVGPVEQRSAIDASRVYVPATDGRIVALSLASGKPEWEFDVGIKPTEPLVYDGHVMAGSAGKRFCSVEVATGRETWCYPVGAAVVGKPAADQTLVYFSAWDNHIWAHDRKNGAYRWKRDLRYRPSSGPILVGTSVAAPGSIAVVPVFETRRGAPILKLALATPLATLPLYIEATADEPARIAGVTGGLTNVWNVTLAGPAPVAPPAIATEPLSVLPGLTIPIGGAPTPLSQ